MASKKAVIYGRVSTQDQDFGRQLNDLDQWAKKNGYQVAERFAEKITGVSKANERKEFNRLLAYIDEHKIKMILVSELSRIGRLGVHTRLEIETLAERGVNIFFYDKNQYTLDHKGKVDSHTMMMIGVVLDLAKIEVENTKQRIISGLKNSARNGKIQSSKFKAYGFTSDENKNIVVRKDEMKIVEKIFNFFDGGMTTHNITAWLNQNKIPTRYNDFKGTLIRGEKAESYSWNTRTVYRVLTNRMLIGERHHKGELVHQFKPVLDVDLFERVQQKLKDKYNRSIRTIKNDNYLKGIIVCQCGCGMFMNVHEAKRVNSYVCLSKIYSKLKKQKPCEYPSINIPKLLNTMWHLFGQVYMMNVQKKMKVNIDDKIEIKKIELKNSETKINQLKDYIDKLYDRLERRVIDERTYVKKNREYKRDLENEIESNEKLKKELQQLQQLKSKPIKESYSYKDFLHEIRNIVKSVVIGKGDKSMDSKLSTKKDIAIKVTITTLADDVFSYHLFKYSKEMLAGYTYQSKDGLVEKG